MPLITMVSIATGTTHTLRAYIASGDKKTEEFIIPSNGVMDVEVEFQGPYEVVVQWLDVDGGFESLSPQLQDGEGSHIAPIQTIINLRTEVRRAEPLSPGVA